MNAIISDKCFMFNDILYTIGDEVVILQSKNAWTLNRTARIAGIGWGRFDLIIYNAERRCYHVNINSGTFGMKKLNELELELI